MRKGRKYYSKEFKEAVLKDMKGEYSSIKGCSRKYGISEGNKNMDKTKKRQLPLLKKYKSIEFIGG